jgi:hypothetical protein
MTIFDLQVRAAESRRSAVSHNQVMAIHRKLRFRSRAWCSAVIGSPSAPPTARDGKLGSFVFGLGVIFAYYIPLTLGPALGQGPP